MLPAVLYAACSDRLIATAGRVAGVQETSVWRWAGVAVLYGLRGLVALPSTARGLRRKLLDATPLPGQPDAPDASGPPVLSTVPSSVLEAAKASLRATIAAGNPWSVNQLSEQFSLTRAQATKVRTAVLAESNGHDPE